MITIDSGLLVHGLGLIRKVPKARDALVAAIRCIDLHFDHLSVICLFIEGSSELQQIGYLLLYLTDDLLADFSGRVGLRLRVMRELDQHAETIYDGVVVVELLALLCLRDVDNLLPQVLSLSTLLAFFSLCRLRESTYFVFA